MTDCRAIISEWLKANGYAGLAGEDCGCDADDLMPCSEPWADCKPAFRWECSPCAELDENGCEFEGEGGCYRTKKQGTS